MNEEFLNFVKKLMEASPQLTKELMTENVKNYLEMLENKGIEKKELTDNGKIILDFLQKETEKNLFTAKEMGENLGISSRTISGAARKLSADGFIEKIGKNPVVYTLTEKGKNYKIGE